MSDKFIDPFGASAPAAQASTNKDVSLVEPDFSTVGQNQTQKVLNELHSRALNEAPLNPWVASALRGASFGLSDRATAGVESLMGDKPYAQYLNEQFAQRDAFNHDHPYGSVATELGGALLAGGPLVGGIKGLASVAVPRAAEYLAGRGLGAALGRGAVGLGGGALAGAVNGAAQSDYGQGEEGAKRGALAGALTAGALGTAGLGLRAASNVAAPFATRLGTSLGLTDPEAWARKELMDSLAHDSDTLPNVLSRMRENESTGPRGTMLMDMAGINTKSKMKAATLPSTAARAELDKRLADRALSQSDRLEDALRNNLSQRLDPANVADEIYTMSRKEADPLYQRARALGQVDDPSVMDWFNGNRNRQTVLQDFARAQADMGRPLGFNVTNDPATGLRVDANPTVEDLMRIKDYYGSLRKRLVDPVTGAVDNKATVRINGNEYGYGDIDNEFRSMRDMLRGVTPDAENPGQSLLGQADRLSADSFDIRRAIDAGQRIHSMSAEEFNRAFSGLDSKAEKEAFKVGAAGALFNKLQNTNPGPAAVRNLYAKPSLKSKLETVFSPDDLRDYFKAMQSEANIAESTRQLQPRVSAASAALQQEAADPSAAGILANAAQGRIGAALSNAGRFFSNEWSSSIPSYADPLLRLGMMGPDETASFITNFKQPGVLSRLSRGYAGAVGNNAPISAAAVAGGQAADYPGLDKFIQDQP